MLFLFVVNDTRSVLVAEDKSSSMNEQTFFGIEGTPVVEHPVRLSDPDLTALAQDDLVKDDMKRDPPITKLTRKDLVASVVHLKDASERDLIVIGTGPRFAGANVDPFWVIRELRDGPHVVLHAGGLGIKIKKSRSLGLYEIETSAVTMGEFHTEVYGFDGTKYVSKARM